MLQNFDIVCIGNATVDAFLTLHEAKKNLRLIKETNELCIKFGEKITVDKVELLVGGNAANVSVGLSRLGLNTSLIAEIGTDEFAQKIINSLIKENVNLDLVKKTEGQTSSFSTIINFQAERTIFSEHVKRQHDFQFDSISTKYVYLTSLGEEWKNAYFNTLNFVKKTNCGLMFNPGTLQVNGNLEDIKEIISNSSVIFLNKEEAQTLLKSESQNINELLTLLKKMGAKISVITDGKNGSYAIDENNNIHTSPIAQAEVVERTGAGDAYSSGFIAAFIHGKSLEESMQWGAKNSASVVGFVGAQTGLLKKEEMENN